MAVSDIGARVKLDGEQQYKEQLRQITQQTKLMKAETTAMEASWDKTTSSMQKATQQTQLLRSQIEQQKNAIATAEANVERYSEATGEGSSQTMKWKTTLAEAKAELSRLEAELQKVPNSLQIMGQHMQSVGQNMQKVGKTMTSVGSTLTRTVTAPIVGLGAVAVKTTADFDSSMSKVAAVSGATGEDFDALRSKAREMGKTTVFSASDAADAMNYMAMAGWKTGDMLEGVEGIMNLAAASGEDLATTSDIVTDALTAFGKSAGDSGRLADIMAAASSNANTNVAMMGETFKYAAPVAGALGFTMEDTAVAIGLMANAGIKSSQAGTALRKGMSNLVKPTKAMKDAMNKYGIEVENSDGSMKSLREIMEITRDTLGGLEEAEQAEAAATIFGQQAMSGWLAVINATDEDFQNLTRSIDNSEGVAKAMAETMTDNLGGQLTLLKSALQELAISFGDILVPHIRKAVEWVQKQVDAFNSLDDRTKEQIVRFAALAAAIGPVLVIGGKLTSGIGKMVEGGGRALEWLGKMIPGFGGVTAAATPMIGAFGLAAGAGVALGLALRDVREKYGDVSAITLFNEQVLVTASNAEQARQKLDESTEAIQRTHENAEKVMAEAEASATMTDRYAEELYDLAGKTERTTDEQRRMEAIISILNNIYPGFTKAVMDSNGQLKVGVGQLKDYIAQLKETARVKEIQGLIEEYTAKIVEATKEQIQAEEALVEAQNAASAAAEQQTQIVSQQVSATDRLSAAEQRVQDLTRQGKVGTQEYADAQAELNAALYDVQHGLTEVDGSVVNATESMGTLANAETTASNEADSLTKSIEENQAAVKESEDKVVGLQEELDTLQAAAGEVGESEEELTAQTGELGDVFEETAEQIDEATQEIIDAYEQARESAYDSAMEQSDLWTALEEQEQTSVQDMRTALQTHIDAYRNWNSNAITLMQSSRYATDENFRALVNSIVQAGQDSAPELAALVQAFNEGDAELTALVNDYGEMSKLAQQASEYTAQAKVAAEYGLEGLNAVVQIQSNNVVAAMARIFGDSHPVTQTMDKMWTMVGKAIGKKASTTGTDIAGSYGSGMTKGKSKVSSGMDDVNAAVTQGANKVRAQKSEAESAGKEIVGSISSGARAARADVDSAFTSIRAGISTNITQIQNLKTNAKSAGSGIASGMASGITSGRSGVSSAMDGIKNTVTSGITSINSAKASATNAGKSIVDSLTSALNGGAGAAQNAGRALGNAVASGVGSASGNASAQARSVANAASNALKAADNNDPWTWGRHMGDNFANGIGSAYGNVVAQARNIANAVKNILQHTTPKEGPLKNDDVWGLHLAQNFAQGMERGIPIVAMAAYDLAETAALPTSTVMDIDAVTGRSVADALTAQDIFEAMSAALSSQETSVVIDGREFSRILRKQGAIA